MTPAKQRIAILGGGVGSMTAAYYLTESADWQQKYEITVYQMGWRLGGKGASGRNADYGQRIEEHGLHIWFGFYDNAFRTIQGAYATLDRPAGAPLRTWQDAFKPQHFVVLQEYVANMWKTWPIEVPGNALVPGQESSLFDPWKLLVTAYEWLHPQLASLNAEAKRLAPATRPTVSAPAHSGLGRIAAALQAGLHELTNDLESGALHALRFLRALPSDLKKHDANDHHALADLLRHLRASLDGWFDHLLDENDLLRRLFIVCDLGLTTLIGMLADGVPFKGFDCINDVDFKDWLRSHGANQRYVVDSAPVRGFYDLVFAFEQGDFARPNIEAGTMLRGMLRISLDFKGAIMWKMQAGMGDTVFTPFYQALRARGVKFEFFHKVDEVIAADGAITQLRLTRQVALRDDRHDYQPLVDVPVKGFEQALPCWPDRPDYAQIEPAQAELLQRHRVNLESHWSDWPQIYQREFGQPLPKRVLQQGVDFDQVIFGISVAAVSQLCPGLLADPLRGKALRDMCDKVQAVATQAYQTWNFPDLAGLGWRCPSSNGEGPVLSGYAEPFDTWAAMDQLLDKECWPPELAPGNVAYFCSALPIAEYPMANDHDFPARCAEAVKASAINNLSQEIYRLWPSVACAGSFDWSMLVDPQHAVGAQRFDSQYWRANVDPSERYVLSLVGSSRYRLASNESGFDHLYLTGDWIRTGLNAGCVEAATMAGMQAARAICGHPRRIAGESD